MCVAARRLARRNAIRIAAGHAFAGDVGNDDGNLVVVDLYPVVVIARDFFGGKVVGTDVVTCDLRILRRQQLQLHLARDFQLAFEPFLLDQLLVQHHLLDDDRHLRRKHHQNSRSSSEYALN